MTAVSMSDVYRKAAEVLVRDGQYKGDLVDFRNVPKGTSEEDALKDPSYPVCAVGACNRAFYELYGLLPESGAYSLFEFQCNIRGHRWIWNYNDSQETTAEDVALVLKQHAYDLEEGTA